MREYGVDDGKRRKMKRGTKREGEKGVVGRGGRRARRAREKLSPRATLHKQHMSKNAKHKMQVKM